MKLKSLLQTFNGKLVIAIGDVKYDVCDLEVLGNYETYNGTSCVRVFETKDFKFKDYDGMPYLTEYLNYEITCMHLNPLGQLVVYLKKETYEQSNH